MVDAGTDWENAYELEHTPWDLRGVTPPLQALAEAGFFERLELPEQARIAVPGCGRGHDLRVFGGLGYRVTGFDIAPAVVQEARALLELNQVAGDTQVLCRDVLALAPEFEEHFHLVYDYTSFCAIRPHLRARFAATMAAILQPGGWYLGLHFPMLESHAGKAGRPPHLITDQALHQTLDERFLLVDSFQPEDSDLGRVGAERWYVWRKRPDPDPV